MIAEVTTTERSADELMRRIGELTRGGAVELHEMWRVQSAPWETDRPQASFVALLADGEQVNLPCYAHVVGYDIDGVGRTYAEALQWCVDGLEAWCRDVEESQAAVTEEQRS